MATAQRETVEKIITETVEEPIFRLEMSQDEAKALFALTGHVLGTSGEAKHIRKIRFALSAAGAPWALWASVFEVMPGQPECWRGKTSN